MITSNLEIVKLESFQELSNFLTSLVSGTYNRSNNIQIINYRDLTKDHFTMGHNTDNDICLPMLFTEGTSKTIYNNGFATMILFPETFTPPNNYLEMVSNSINFNSIKRIDENGRLNIPEINLDVNSSPSLGLIALFVCGDGNSIHNDYYLRLGVEMTRAAFLVQDYGMEMNL